MTGSAPRTAVHIADITTPDSLLAAELDWWMAWIQRMLHVRKLVSPGPPPRFHWATVGNRIVAVSYLRMDDPFPTDPGREPEPSHYFFAFEWLDDQLVWVTIQNDGAWWNYRDAEIDTIREWADAESSHPDYGSLVMNGFNALHTSRIVRPGKYEVPAAKRSTAGTPHTVLVGASG